MNAVPCAGPFSTTSEAWHGGGAALTGSGGGAGFLAKGVPQSKQNFAAGGFEAPQLAQIFSAGAAASGAGLAGAGGGGAAARPRAAIPTAAPATAPAAVAAAA